MGRDECRLGSSCGGGGVVHSPLAGAAFSVAGENQGGGVWEYEHQWDCHFGTCHHILLHTYHIDHCNWYSHTRLAISSFALAIPSANELLDPFFFLHFH